MNEKEKMISGYLYDPSLDGLNEDRDNAKDLCFEFNNLRPSNAKEKRKLLKKLFHKISDSAWIEAPFYCDYGYNIEAGELFFANHNCVILDCAKVKFGDRVLIGPNCGFYTAGHPLDADTRKEWLEFAQPINVGDDVWFGGNVCVMPNVTIGSNCVIGAGSVVTKDIPSNVIAAGNPCRAIREITYDDKKKYKRYIG